MSTCVFVCTWVGKQCRRALKGEGLSTERRRQCALTTPHDESIDREGPNPGKLLALKLVLPLGQLTEPPCSFLVIDAVRCMYMHA